MNRQKLNFAAMLTLAVAAAAVAFDATSDFKTYLNKLEPQVSKAFADKNVEFFRKISTEDFRYIDANGKAENKKQSLESMKQMFGMAQKVTAKFKRLSASVKGNAGNATYQGHMTMVMAGPDKKTHKMEMTTYTQETYKKVGNKWLVQTIRETKQPKMLMDGKPMDPSMMAPVAPQTKPRGGG